MWQYGSECSPKFFTVTFEKNIVDIDEANYELTKFIKRLNYRIFESKKSILKYSCVIHFQDRGAVHYHIVFYNMPYVNVNLLAEIWGHGFVKINKIDSVNNVGAYMTAYLGSDLDDERLQGRKSFFSSRGLLKPVEITENKKVEQLASALLPENVTYESTFDNEYVGQVVYKQYNLNTLINQ